MWGTVLLLHMRGEDPKAQQESAMGCWGTHISQMVTTRLRGPAPPCPAVMKTEGCPAQGGLRVPSGQPGSWRSVRPWGWSAPCPNAQACLGSALAVLGAHWKPTELGSPVAPHHGGQLGLVLPCLVPWPAQQCGLDVGCAQLRGQLRAQGSQVPSCPSGEGMGTQEPHHRTTWEPWMCVRGTPRDTHRM